MKFYKYSLALLTLATVAMSSCKNEDIDNKHHYDNKLYVSSATVCNDLLIKDKVTEYSREVSYRIAEPADKDIEISFDVIPSKASAYNLIYNDRATALDSYFYDIPKKKVTIKAGDISSENIVVNFKHIDELDKNKRYVLPVVIDDVSGIEVLESKRTVYFVIKEAALINVVANIKEVDFRIYWNRDIDVSKLSTLTVEALVRSDDWVAGRDNAISTIFGVEGKFLIRVGDSDRPRDQIQIVTPEGKFPGPNSVEELPVKEWVHIAVVYDASTSERIYYRNGVAVYSDKNATNQINLTNQCFIGFSFDNSRRLPGDISEVRVWGIQRTAEQIANNPYKVDPESEGLIAYWKFDEGAGNTIYDRTGNKNDISSQKSPVWVDVELPKVK